MERPEKFIEEVLRAVERQHLHCGGGRMPSPVGYLDVCGEVQPVAQRLLAVAPKGVTKWYQLTPLIEASVRVLLSEGKLRRLSCYGYEWFVPASYGEGEADGTESLEWEHHDTQKHYEQWVWVPG